MPSFRVNVQLIGKSGKLNKWNPHVSPIDFLAWKKRREQLLAPQEFLFSTLKNKSFLFNVDPTPPVVDDLSWRHKFFYNDYLSSILNFKQNNKINAAVLVPIIPLSLDYYRRYLNDPETVGFSGPAVSLPAGTETTLTGYFRRYLNDPTS